MRSLRLSLVSFALFGSAVSFLGCAPPPDEDPAETESTTGELAVAGSNYGVSVTGQVELKYKTLTTHTISVPKILSGKVIVGPKPATCTTRASDGAKVCHYTMEWRGVTVQDFTANGNTVRKLVVETKAPIYLQVVNNKFTVAANTARFILTGTNNGKPFYMDRALDAVMTGTFDTGLKTFSVATVVTRFVSGPLGFDIRTWGNVKLSGAVATLAPVCQLVSGGGYACEPGAIPTGPCVPSKVHRSVIQCNGSSKSPDEVIDLASGYSNYTCSNRFASQCIGDGSFDAYYREWCEYDCH
jgi:hypothetical protein